MSHTKNTKRWMWIPNSHFFFICVIRIHLSQSTPAVINVNRFITVILISIVFDDIIDWWLMQCICQHESFLLKHQLLLSFKVEEKAIHRNLQLLHVTKNNSSNDMCSAECEREYWFQVHLSDDMTCITIYYHVQYAASWWQQYHMAWLGLHMAALWFFF